MEKYIVICVTVLVALSSSAQLKYPHRYFDPREYQSGKEILCIDESDDGTIYIGTNNSLVRFDGERWEESTIPGKKVIYWLRVDDKTNRIYIASTGEFGYFDETLIYYSLSDSLGDDVRDFGAIWEVDLSSHGVYFRSSKYIFRYHEEELTRINPIGPSESPFDIVFTVRDTVYTRVKDVGLASVYDGELKILVNSEIFGLKSNAFMPHPDGVLIATRTHGLFLYANGTVIPWDVDVNDLLIEGRVYHAIALSNGRFAFATLTAGVIIMDENGGLHHLIKKDNYGIYEGTGYVFEDGNSGLWIGTKKGMARVDLNSPIQYYQLNEIDENTSFEYFNDQLYFGSVNGMYTLPDQTDQPQKVEGFPNLVTRIFTCDGMLIATDLTNFFVINGNKAQEIFHPPLTSLTATTMDGVDYVGGEQEGLAFIKKTPSWELVASDEKAVKNVSLVIEHKEKLWGISSSGGLFRYENGEAYFYNVDRPSSLDIYKNQLVLTTSEGFKTYSLSKDEFETLSELDSLLPNEFSEVEGFYTQEESTWITYFNNEKSLTGDVFQAGKLVRQLPVFDARVEEKVSVQLRNGILFVSNGEEILRYDIGKSRTSNVIEPANAQIQSPQFVQSTRLPYSQNQVRFDFTVKATYSTGDNYYRYRIKGYNDKWSDWTSQNYMEIANLFEGNYTIQLEARTPDRNVAKASLAFTILPPWHRTYWAYTGYVISFMIIVWGVVKWRSRYLEDERNKLETLVASRTSEIVSQKAMIEESLKEREVLLREIHHRVKNNLQVITSIFNMQLKEAKTDEIKKLINDGQSRVKTMSLIHQKLYQSDKLDAIELEDYANGLINQINQLYSKSDYQIEHEVDAKGVRLDIDTAIPVGLILNELLSNSYKYAFKDGSGRISIKVSRKGASTYLLKYCDNGNGFPKGFKIEDSDSLGLRLVSILARQLKGELNFENGKGVCFQIEFKAVAT